MRKGKEDLICDGKTGILKSLLSLLYFHDVLELLLSTTGNIVFMFSEVTQVSTFGSPRRCGGQGDILAGRSDTFSVINADFCLILVT